MINLDIKKLLKTSFNLGKQNYWELLFLTILPSICFYLIFFYVLFNGYKNFSDSILILAGLFTFILLSIIIFPFMSSLILESMNQPNLQFKYWRYLFYTIAINIIIVLGFMFLFLPSIYLTFIFLFVPLLALLGDEKPFINSKKLVKNYFWIILGLVLVCSSFGALAGAIYKFFIFAFEKSVYFGFLKFLFISLIMPFLLPIHFILYFRLKAEKENEDVLEKYNLDIEQLENKKKFSKTIFGAIIILLLITFFISLIRYPILRILLSKDGYELAEKKVQKLQPKMHFLNNKPITLPLGFTFAQAVWDYCLKKNNMEFHIKIIEKNKFDEKKELMKIKKNINFETLKEANGFKIYEVGRKKLYLIKKDLHEYTFALCFVERNFNKRRQKILIELLKYFNENLNNKNS